MVTSPASTHRGNRRPVYLLLCGAVLLWSFGWTYVCGRRGMFIFDQSVVFDAGWRILCGQVPYKDFLMAPGPITPLIQAMFFKVLGVTWTAFVVSAASIAVGSAICTMRITHLLFAGKQPGLVLATGFLVGSLYQSLFGTLWFEHTAFFFCFLGILAVVESLRFAGYARFLLQFAAGCSAMLAILSKQNAGVFSFALIAGFVVVAEWPAFGKVFKGTVAYGLGSALIAGVFVFWLVMWSDYHRFIHATIEVPAQDRVGRLLKLRYLFLPEFLANTGGTHLPNASTVTPWCHAFALGAVSLAAFCLWYDKDTWCRFKTEATFRLAIYLAATMPFVQAFFQSTTKQEVKNMLFFSGFCLTLGYGVASAFCQSPPVKKWLLTTASAIGVFLMVDGLSTGWYRLSHYAFSTRPTIERNLRIPSLSGLQWLDSTYVWALFREPTSIDALDVENVYNYLVAHPERFYVCGDSSFFYGITGTVPPQPLLYLTPHLYYSPYDTPRLDAEILGDLQRDNIRLVVREKIMAYSNLDNSPKAIDSFPRLQAWLNEDFTVEKTFGNYEILVHK